MADLTKYRPAELTTRKPKHDAGSEINAFVQRPALTPPVSCSAAKNPPANGLPRHIRARNGGSTGGYRTHRVDKVTNSASTAPISPMGPMPDTSMPLLSPTGLRG
jgi:hypothetical protein